MKPRARFAAIFLLGFIAALGAGLAALEPLRAADAAAMAVWGEIAEMRDEIAALDPGASGGDGAPSRAEMLGRLDRAEREFAARRTAIVRMAAVHLSIALAAATAAFWLAVALASRGARSIPAAVPVPAAAPPESPAARSRSFVADPEGRLRTVGGALAAELGRPSESFAGEPIAALFPPEARERVETIIASIGPTRPSAHIDIALAGGDPIRCVRLRLHARFDEAGLVTAIEGEGREIAPAEAAKGEANGASPPRRRGSRSLRGGAGDDAGGAVREGAPSRSEPARLAGAQILVALGGADQRRLVAFLLGRVGARVTAVADGRELLATLDPSRGERFDAVLLEPQLPAIDGLAAARILRERGVDVPIVALVRGGDPRAHRACLEAGCAETAPKPVDRRTLVAAIAKVLPQLDPA